MAVLQDRLGAKKMMMINYVPDPTRRYENPIPVAQLAKYGITHYLDQVRTRARHRDGIRTGERGPARRGGAGLATTLLAQGVPSSLSLPLSPSLSLPPSAAKSDLEQGCLRTH